MATLCWSIVPAFVLSTHRAGHVELLKRTLDDQTLENNHELVLHIFTWPRLRSRPVSFSPHVKVTTPLFGPSITTLYASVETIIEFVSLLPGLHSDPIIWINLLAPPSNAPASIRRAIPEWLSRVSSSRSFRKSFSAFPTK